jgi:TonB family protein
MRRILACLPVLLLVACSSSEPTPERAETAPPAEQQAAAKTDACLDNPDLARSWGECNVKQTVYLASDQLARCRSPKQHPKGTVNLELKVKADGHVRSARVVNGRHGKITACVARVMKSLRFAPPPKGKEATITVPYQLEP